MIKNIIFDLGGVVILQNKMESGKFISQIFDINMDHAKSILKDDISRLNKGQMTSLQLLRRIKVKLKSNKSDQELMYFWEHLYKKELIGINRELIKVIKKLKINYNLYLFTNTIDTHYAVFRKMNVEKYFKKVFVSFLEGVRKPEKKAFLHVLKKIKTRSEECLFIDDLGENVRAAQNIGMKGIIYKNINQFKKELSKFGLKI